ncbi:hypothetical protein CR513_22150, partial [Mucuna pruriens]
MPHRSEQETQTLLSTYLPKRTNIHTRHSPDIRFLRHPTAPKNRSGGTKVVVPRLFARAVPAFLTLRRRRNEICERVGATQLDGRVVVHNGGFLGGVVGSQPEPYAARRVSYLRRPLPPRTLPHSAELPPEAGPRRPPTGRSVAGLEPSSFGGNGFGGSALDGNLVDEVFDSAARGGHGGLVVVAGGVRGVGVGDTYSYEFGVGIEFGAVKVVSVLDGRRGSHNSIEGVGEVK